MFLEVVDMAKGKATTSKEKWVIKWFGPLCRFYPAPPRRKYDTREEAEAALLRYAKRNRFSWGTIKAAYHVGIGIDGDPNSWYVPTNI